MQLICALHPHGSWTSPVSLHLLQVHHDCSALVKNIWEVLLCTKSLFWLQLGMFKWSVS